MDDHKSLVSEVFDRAAPAYGTHSTDFFNYFGRQLVSKVHVQAKQQVLDVATGKGAVLFPLADAVGLDGNVVGIDISTEMLKETAKVVQEKRLDCVDLFCMDAEQLKFLDHSFDYVFCGFAIFFFPSISKALSEFKRVLKPGGSLVVSTWGEDSELEKWMGAELKKFGLAKSLVATHVWSAEDLQKVLQEAGFQNIKITEETKTIQHGNAELWWESLWTHGIRAKFEQLTPEQLENLKSRALKHAQELCKNNVVEEDLQVFYGVATV